MEMNTAQLTRLDHWVAIVRGSIALRGTAEEQRAQALQIARVCAIEEAAGRNCSSWHCTSIVMGHLHRCPCSPCSARRKAISQSINAPLRRHHMNVYHANQRDNGQSFAAQKVAAYYASRIH